MDYLMGIDLVDQEVCPGLGLQIDAATSRINHAVHQAILSAKDAQVLGDAGYRIVRH